MDKNEPEGSTSNRIAGPSAYFHRSLAVVIGIDTYGDGISQLRSAVADAKAVADALQHNHGFETWCLFDDDAQLPHLLELLRERLPGALGTEDRLLFYFAGHGIALDSDVGPAGYLVPAHARRSEHEGLLPMRVLHDELTDLPIRHALIILDCCFAGAFRWSSLREIEPEKVEIYRERYDRYIQNAAWQVLTSASSDQPALDRLANHRNEGAGTHSPFALALLGGLAGAADLTKDNVITADELAIYTRQQVASAAEAAGHRQIPQLFPLARHDSGQFVFQVPRSTLVLTAAPALTENANPYRGLHSFQKEDRTLFFGRDAAIQRLVGAVETRQLTVVVGPSGCGKSSLVNAGLVPALGDKGWTVLPPQRPGREPLTVLDLWTRTLGGEQTPDAPMDSWLTAVAVHVSARPDHRWLAVVDQFEELLTHQTTESTRNRFLSGVASALRTAPNLHLVVTVRSDAEPQFHDTALEPWWAMSRFMVPTMTRDELRQIIEKPAKTAALYFHPSQLVERLIDDVTLVPSPLPLLSFALSELYRYCWTRWQSGVRDRDLRETDYDHMGSVGRALTQRATNVHDALTNKNAEYAVTIQNIFVRMVAIVGGENARRRVALDELVYDDPLENQRVAEVRQRFDEARLISQGTEGTRGSQSIYIEPMHDELIRGWNKVNQWLGDLDKTAGTRALLGALGDAVRSWKVRNQDDSYLWNDPRIDLLDELRRTHKFVFNADEARFVGSSVRRRRIRRVRLIGGLLTVIMVLAIATGVALWQRQRASDEAERANQNASEANLQREAAAASANLARTSANQAKRNEEIARRNAESARKNEDLALEREREAKSQEALAKQRAAEAEAEVSLTMADPDVAVAWLRKTPASFENAARAYRAANQGLSWVLPQHEGALEKVAWSKQGRLLATQAGGGFVHVWDLGTGEHWKPMDHSDVMVWSWSPDGKALATGARDGSLWIWNSETKTTQTTGKHAQAITTLAWAPDGSKLASGSADHSVRIWSTRDWRFEELVDHQDRITTLGWSSTSEWLAAGAHDGGLILWASRSHQITNHISIGWTVDLLAWSPTSDTLAISSRHPDNRKVLIYSIKDNKMASLDQHKADVSALAWSPDGKKLATGSFDTKIRIWDVQSHLTEPPGKHITPQELEGGPAGISVLAWSPDGKFLASSTSHEGGPLHFLWNSPENNHVRVLDTLTGGMRQLRAHGGIVTTLDWSPDGRALATGSVDRRVRIWDLAPALVLARSMPSMASFSSNGQRLLEGQQIHDLKTRVIKTLPGLEGRGVWSPTNPALLAEAIPGILGTKIRLWNIEADTMETITYSIDAPSINPLIRWSPNGNRLAICSNMIYRNLEHQNFHVIPAYTFDVVISNLNDKSKITKLQGFEGGVFDLAWSADSRLLATSSQDDLLVWADTGAPENLERDVGIFELSWSPRSPVLAYKTHAGEVKLWDGRLKKVRRLGQFSGLGSGLAWSRDGSHLASGTSSGSVIVWNITTEQMRTFSGNQSFIKTLAWSPAQDHILAVGAIHDSIRVWDVNRAVALSLNGYDSRNSIIGLEWSLDGRHLIATSEHGSRIWDLLTDHAAYEASLHRGPNISINEYGDPRIEPFQGLPWLRLP